MGAGTISVWQPPSGLENDPELDSIIGLGMCDGSRNLLIPRLNMS